jgi:hypothetical protein
MMMWGAIKLTEYCCQDLVSLLGVSSGDGPIIIKSDLTIEILGYHEPIGEDRGTGLKLKFCPFCGSKLGGPEA